MHPSVHKLSTTDWTEYRVVLVIILWQTVAAFLIALWEHVLTILGRSSRVHVVRFNLPGLWLWNMVLLSAVDMLVLPPIFAFTQYYYHTCTHCLRSKGQPWHETLRRS